MLIRRWSFLVHEEEVHSRGGLYIYIYRIYYSYRYLMLTDGYITNSRVLLGSFSNYLVTKSSVPVMVARKRLRKHSKFKKTNIRQANNLTAVKTLVSAKID